MHRAHDGKLPKATGVEVLDKLNVLGEISQVSGRVVLETVAPGHV